MEFHVFDLIEPLYPQYIRVDKLQGFMSLVRPDSSLKVVPTRIAFSFEEIWDHYKRYLSEGYEGIIVRNINAPYIKRRSTQIMKFKPKKDDYYTIIGMNEEIDKYGNPKGRLGSLICLGSTGDSFTVGSGLTDQARNELWGQNLTGWLVHVQYQSTFSGTGIPRFPVFMELINPERVLTGCIELDPNSD